MKKTVTIADPILDNLLNDMSKRLSWENMAPDAKIRPTQLRRDRLTITVGVAQTQIRHTLGTVPTDIFVLPRGSETVWRSSDPDEDFIYLTASGSVLCDVTVLG